MSTVTAPRPGVEPPGSGLPDTTPRLPAWLARVPMWLWIGGGLTLLAYAIHRRDPVFITGQSLGVFVYTRNLMLIRRERRRTSAVG